MWWVWIHIKIRLKIGSRGVQKSLWIHLVVFIWAARYETADAPFEEPFTPLSSAITKTVTAVDRNAPSKETGFNRHQDVQPLNSDQSYHSIKPKQDNWLFADLCKCFVCFVNLKWFWNTNKNNFAFVCDTIIVNPQIISCHLMA